MLCIIGFFAILHGYAFPPEDNSKIFSLTPSIHSTEIPFRLVNDLIVIPVIVDGKQQMNFLVDTGTRTPLILHNRYVKNLDLSLGRKVRFQGAGNGNMVQGTVVPDMHLQIGDAFAKNIGIVVLGHNPLSHLKLDGITIHGIIGASLFHSFAVEIDFLSQIIRLHNSPDFLKTANYSSIPMQVNLSRPILQVPVEWKDSIHTLNLMIDTGFNHHLLIYDHPDIHFRTPKLEKIGMGYSGNIMGNTANIKRLYVGERTFFDVHTCFPLRSDYKAKGIGDGIMGNALLKQFCVVLDYANNRFHIKEFIPWQPTNFIKIAKAT